MLAHRKVLRGESFDLHFGKAPPPAQGRLGLIIPKRLARNASLRNAVKRQGREAFRLLGLALGNDLVLRLKRPQTKSKADPRQQKKLWRQEIETLMKRLASPDR